MTNRLLGSAFAFAVMAVTLAGCTSLAPVYGDPASGRDVSSVRFNFAPPDSHIEQIILNRLKVAFPGPALLSDPVLDIAASTSSPQGSMSNAYEVARPVNVRVEATVTIMDGEETIFEATRFTDTAYQSGKLTPTDIASAAGARETAARSTAEALRAAILAGYSR
ncbi:hypothetical protein [Devosia marina]|uniref:LPS-assembly lipoprotein n=1 Tax=Devosia marina TaxID=2683198 RepID=A0A7X3K243_9HYPH|nr:hypothetical protein [Devosia marina]MVS97490.1 hypothetical protein [Devosia marina]